MQSDVIGVEMQCPECYKKTNNSCKGVLQSAPELSPPTFTPLCSSSLQNQVVIPSMRSGHLRGVSQCFSEFNRGRTVQHLQFVIQLVDASSIYPVALTVAPPFTMALRTPM